VRAYVATGDTRFLTYYYGLADYRNGKTAAPSDDPVQYWEEVIAGLREYVPSEGSGKPFPARMREAGFSSEELIVLERALGTSDRLHKQDQIAFAATQGLYDPATGQFVSDGKPNMGFALKLVFGAEYAKLQARLNLEISRLASLADTRTNSSVQGATTHLLQAVVLAGAAMSMLLAISLLASLFLDRYVLQPIQSFARLANRIAAGDYATRLESPKGWRSCKSCRAPSTTWRAPSSTTSSIGRRCCASSTKPARSPNPQRGRSRCSSRT
jgi:HAMP domain-containing protein